MHIYPQQKIASTPVYRAILTWSMSPDSCSPTIRVQTECEEQARALTEYLENKFFAW